MERRALVAFFVFLFVGLPGYSQPCLSIDHSSFDFGEVMDGAVVEHTFLLKNVGDMTLKIFRVAYNCSCTSYEIPKTEIAPGESVPLTVRFTTTGYSALPQPISQTVTIYSNDPANPHKIALQGRVLATQSAATIQSTADTPLLSGSDVPASRIPLKPTLVNLQVDLVTPEDAEAVLPILDLIESYGWRTSVYVTGKIALAYPDLVKEIHDRGHQIGVLGWEAGEDLLSLSEDELYDRLENAFLAVRAAVGEMRPEYIADFKPQGYRVNETLLRVLLKLGIRSCTAIFPDGASHPHHLAGESAGLVAIPLGRGPQEQQVLADDIYTRQGSSGLEGFFTDVVAYYESNRVKYESVVLSVHPGIIAAEQNWRRLLAEILNYFALTGGEIALTDLLTTKANPYIAWIDITAPTSADPSEDISITVRYQATCYCPWYLFRIYARRPGEAWQLKASRDDPLPSVGIHEFTIPLRTPSFGTSYEIRVVGRACHGGHCPPSDTDYEAMDETTIQLFARILPVPGYIPGDKDVCWDLLFFGDESYQNQSEVFLQHVAGLIKEIETKVPESSGKFNFWYYTSPEARLEVNDKGEVVNITIPSVDFAFNTGVVLHQNRLRDCTIPRASGLWIFSCEGDNRDLSFIHELGHAAFRLEDEYDRAVDGCWPPYQTASKNVWPSLKECQEAAAQHGWNAEDCQTFSSCGGKSWTRICDQPSGEEIMVSNRGVFGPACIRGILDQYQTWADHAARVKSMRKLGQFLAVQLVRLVVGPLGWVLIGKEIINEPASLDYPTFEGQFKGRVLSNDGNILFEFEIWDPRIRWNPSPGDPRPLQPSGLNAQPYQASEREIMFFLPYFYNEAELQIEDKATGEKVSFDLSDFTSAVLLGKVTRVDGTPVADATVAVRGPVHSSTTSEADGSYVIALLPSGKYEVSVIPSDPLLKPVMTTVDLIAGQSFELNFVLEPAGAIQGSVRDVRDESISGVWIYLAGFEPPHYYVTEGQYVIPGLAAGVYTVVIDAPGYGEWYIYVNGQYVTKGTSVTVEVELGKTTRVDFTQRSPGVGLIYDFEYTSQAEAEAAGWTFTGLWKLITEEQARRFSPRPTPFPSPTHAAYFGNENGNYVTLGTLSTEAPPDRPELRLMQAGSRRSYGELTSPAIPVSGVSSVEVSFQYFRVVEYYPKGSYDKTYVQVSFDGGSWETIWSLDSTTPSEPGWKSAGPITISVPTGASTMRVRFAFDSVDHFYNNYLGWLVDNVRIMSAQPGVTRFNYSNLTVAPTAGPIPLRITAVATLTNIGTTRGTENVRFFVDGVERATRAVTLYPGSSTTVTFDYTFTDPGNYSVTIDNLPPVTVRAGMALFYEGFEAGALGWEFTNLWHISSDSGCFQCEKLSGAYAYYAQGCNYNTRARTKGTLTSPVIDLQGAQFVQIRFDHFRHVEQYAGGDFDRTTLEISFDGGPWTTVWMRSSRHPSPECGTVTIGPFAVPSGATAMRLRFVFDSVDQYYNDFRGWAVDNVTVAPASSGQPLATFAIEPSGPRSLAELISVFNVPNPVRDVHTTTFVVRGVEAEKIRVEVYDLAGRLVWQGEGLGNELTWGTQDLTGLPLANGVYLWRVWVKVGEEWVVSAIQKLVILR